MYRSPVENILPETKLPVAEKTNSTLHSSGNLLSVVKIDTIVTHDLKTQTF